MLTNWLSAPYNHEKKAHLTLCLHVYLTHKVQLVPVIGAYHGNSKPCSLEKLQLWQINTQLLEMSIGISSIFFLLINLALLLLLSTGT